MAVYTQNWRNCIQESTFHPRFQSISTINQKGGKGSIFHEVLLTGCVGPWEDDMCDFVFQLYEHHLNIRQMQVGSEFQMPRNGILQVYILGELSSAEHFEYDNLFVHYFFELPKG
jgi:hypothetical protein